ncbi:Hypothetical protein LEPBI_I1064 [Leptospira biflexa serovar Patoc strain 'Patoc 1 (Paris)']|uniref:Uncharacterized protein n=1 Tax=Leptospira biflexa serovar Patoc (strain Patoc 1 / ATCC 23582 / Paris) TaxID=456481 RepID=B0SN00_LEPBP|nr:Hypothetical protein LEPBI_I1064 [Leptospira biflexa serovar Patoc strain 'Patoc 1 (Paris)']
MYISPFEKLKVFESLFLVLFVNPKKGH